LIAAFPLFPLWSGGWCIDVYVVFIMSNNHALQRFHFQNNYSTVIRTDIILMSAFSLTTINESIRFYYHLLFYAFGACGTCPLLFTGYNTIGVCSSVKWRLFVVLSHPLEKKVVQFISIFFLFSISDPLYPPLRQQHIAQVSSVSNQYPNRSGAHLYLL